MPVEFKRQLRTAFPGVLIHAGAYTPSAHAKRSPPAGPTSSRSGRPFVANPDLPERLRTGAALTPHDRNTLFGGGERGLTDYPTLAWPRPESAYPRLLMRITPFPPVSAPRRWATCTGTSRTKKRWPRSTQRGTAVSATSTPHRWECRPRRVAPRRSARGRPRDAYSLGTVGRLVLDEHEDASQRDLGEKAACSATGCRTGSSRLHRGRHAALDRREPEAAAHRPARHRMDSRPGRRLSR